jgi:DNA-binding transcriptional MerR regulator
MNPKEQLYSIQQLSTKLNIPKPTLRFWEKEFDGILLPFRTNGGQRRYAPEHVCLLKEIKTLKKTGLRLGEIKRKLRNTIRSEAVRQRYRMERKDRIEHLADRVAEVVRSEIVRFFEKGQG